MRTRHYRTWGYPVVPAVFVLVTIYLIGFTIYNAPLLSFLGLINHRGGLAGVLVLRKEEPGNADSRTNTTACRAWRRSGFDS